MTNGIFYFRFAPAKMFTNLSFSEIPTPALVLVTSLRQVLNNNAVKLLRLSYPDGDYDFRRMDIGQYEWKCAYRVRETNEISDIKL